ncbi:MAG: AMP-binding protein, partial [bacterium]
MIDAGRASSLGDALESAFARWSGETCLVEADRDRENARLTYAELAERARCLDAFLRARGFAAGGRAAIVMTNQSKWHIAACAIFRAGGVLVPLDCKLEAAEHLRLVAHCRAQVLVVEHFLWSAMSRAEGFEGLGAGLVVVTEAPRDRGIPPAPGADVVRWEDTAATTPEAAPPAPRSRNDVACIVYSSGTGGRPKGCLLTHGNYLAQLESLTALHPMRPGVRYLSILPTNHAIDFMVGFLGPYL